MFTTAYVHLNVIQTVQNILNPAKHMHSHVSSVSRHNQQNDYSIILQGGSKIRPPQLLATRMLCLLPSFSIVKQRLQA